MKTATVKNIAELAKVSTATVSLVLNGRGSELRIQQETQDRILAVARELNYQANYLARGLAGKSTQTIGVSMGFAAYHNQETLRRALLAQFDKRGYRMYLADPLGEVERLLADIEEFRRRGVSALVVGLYREWFDRSDISDVVEAIRSFRNVIVVIKTCGDLPQLPFPVIRRDPTLGHRRMVENFVNQGRQKIGMVTYVNDNSVEIESFAQAMNACGLTVTPDSIVNLDPWSRKKLDHVQQMFDALESSRLNLHSYDAIYCTADEGCAVIMGYLIQKGIRIPEDIAIVGNNDDPFCRAMFPPLASMEWHNDLLLELLDDLVFNQIEHGNIGPCVKTVPIDFIWRESAGKSVEM